MKKILLLTKLFCSTVMCMLLLSYTGVAHAATIDGVEYPDPSASVTNSWESGDCVVKLYSNNTVVVSGTGAMADYSDYGPWGNSRSNMKRIVAESGVTRIGNGAFGWCAAITDISLPEVTSIGNRAFSDCTGITNVNLPKVVSVGERAFYRDIGIVGIDLPEVTSINSTAFHGCSNIVSINLPKITSIGDSAFKGCRSIIDIDLPEVTSINSTAFNGCSGVISINIPKVTSISDSAFKDCSALVTPIVLGDVEYLGSDVFSGVPAKEVSLHIAESSTSISSDALSGMKGLNTVKITSTGRFAFGLRLPKTAQLSKVYILCNMNPTYDKVNLPSTATVYCISGSTVEAWCINNQVAYKVLTDGEVEDIINGKLPTLQQDSFLFDGAQPEDLVFRVNLGTQPAGAANINKVLVDNKSLASTNYTFDGTEYITIKKEFISTLKDGTHALSVQFNNGTFRSGASITVISSTQGGTGDNEDPPEALVTINYEFYKDYPDFIVIPVKLNGATAITELKIGSDIVDPTNYKLEAGALIIDKDYITTLEVGKYRVLPTFNDIHSTTIPNIKLIVYEHAAD